MLYCSMCHTSNSEILKYCKNCGEPLKNKHTKAERLEKLLVDRYRVMSPLKIGAMSGVYLAKDIRLNSLCAVKELYIKLFPDDDRDLTIQNFKSEAELLANLRHPSLPRVIDYFYEEGKYYLVMDYISGCDLFTILEKDGIPWLSQEVVLPWGIEICDVLIYLHNQSPPVIYRDLKPSNIMIRKNDQKLMLVDFGLAQMFHFKPASNEKALGTQGYAPPEQYAGREEPRSDLYSLGVTLHHLLSGTPPETPFKFQSLREINKDISPEIDKIIMKAIERDISLRYPDVLSMKKELLVVLDKLGISKKERKLYILEDKTSEIEKIERSHKVIKNKEVVKKKIKIFIVEDDKIVRRMLTMYIKLTEDMEIIGEASNGREAIEQFKKFETIPDITLMDISMPDVDGIKATGEIIKIAPDAKILMLTALECTREIVIESFKAGAKGYIIKDTDIDDIAESIRKAYEGGSPIEPKAACLLINEITSPQKFPPKN